MALRIALAQINPLIGDIAGNTDMLIDVAERARDEQGAGLVLFPELTLTGYPPEDLLLRPQLHERVRRAVVEIRRRLRGVAVLFGLPLAHQLTQAIDGRVGANAHGAIRGLGDVDVLQNCAMLVRDDLELARYAKQLLPNYGVFDEKRYFAPGRECVVVTLDGVRIGLSICEDIWESGPALEAAARGAELFLNINASPYHLGKALEREQMLARRAREAGLPILYVNPYGGQDELVFDGGSLAVAANGNLVYRAPRFQGDLGLIELDGRQLRAVEQGGKPAITELLTEEEEIYRALLLGTRDYVERNGFDGALVGLSGGIDSALTLCIAVDALGPDRVEAVLMPSRYTSEMSIEDAIQQAEALGVRHTTISIEPLFERFLEQLAPRFEGAPPDTTEENIQARCRGVILMAISNKSGRMLLTTGNKSEMSVGYATLYGDMAGGFAPIKDVPKMLVYRLARHRNRLGDPVIPERVLSRAPSAELAPDQRDQDSLPAYELLDPILEAYIEEDQSVDEIVSEGFDRETVLRVARLVDRNEYKRRQAPPGVRISRRAFGRDRRYPITSGFAQESKFDLGVLS